MLLDLFKEKRCFKLVCGAGNEDSDEVEKLVTLYSEAGCNFFDLSAKSEIIDAAKRGLERAGITKDRYLCCSVGIKGDPHVSKAEINLNCKTCGNCIKICPQNAISQTDNEFIIDSKRCIGCGKCFDICEFSAIDMKDKSADLKKVLPQIIDKGIDCIEFHAISEDEKEVDEKWEDINNLYDGILSICVDRSKLGDEKLVQRVRRMLEKRKPYTTIIQADGAPMSGGEDDYKTTLQTVAAAEIFQNAKLPIYLLLSGGTNSKTTKLASLCGIDCRGVAIGSYARKIVKEYVSRDDFFENKPVYNQALQIAKNLVNISLGNIK